MNYYKHHFGDYDTRTQHLTWSQDLAYRRLICVYYVREKPLPNDLRMIYRMVKASNGPQQQATRDILLQFFTQDAQGLYHNSRCDEEILKYQAQASANRSNSAKPDRNESSANGIASRSPNLEPRTKNLELNTSSVVLNTLPGDDTDALPIENPTPKLNGEHKPQVTKAGYWAIELRKLNVKTTSMHPTMLQLIEDGYELPSVVEAVSIARQRKPFPELIGIGYLDPIVRNPPKASVKSWYSSESATLDKAKELGIAPRPGEDWDELRDRLRTAGG